MIMQNYCQFMLGALQINLSVEFNHQIRIIFETIINTRLQDTNVRYNTLHNGHIGVEHYYAKTTDNFFLNLLFTLQFAYAFLGIRPAC